MCYLREFTMIKWWVAAASRGIIEFVGHNCQSVVGHNVIQLIEFCRHTIQVEFVEIMLELAVVTQAASSRFPNKQML